MIPFCGAIDTLVSDFWWCLIWVSKPEWVLPYLSLAEAYVLRYTFSEIHLWWDTCLPLGGQHGSRTVSSTYLQGIGGTRNRELSCRHSQCEIRQTLYRLSYPGSAWLTSNLKCKILVERITIVMLTENPTFSLTLRVDVEGEIRYVNQRCRKGSHSFCISVQNGTIQSAIDWKYSKSCALQSIQKHQYEKMVNSVH